ncbi:MAG: hypothetical protein KGO02_20140 [Alphaproteobacteria bacterium]|nr:hypothetical protein [Alphaproteobacteria bacterium]
MSVVSAPPSRAMPRLAAWEWAFLGLFDLGCALFVMSLGKDMSWDFRNYHWYIPYAFLHGRMGFDIAVAHQGTYYNPFIDVPFYWLATHLPAYAALGIMGAIQGANIFPLYVIARSLLRLPDNRVPAALLAAFCMTGGMTVSLFGTTYYDNVMSLFVLTGLAIVLSAHRTLIAANPWKGALIAACGGIAVGSAVGLKLPEAPFALGFAAAIAVIPGTAARRALRLAGGAAGGIAGTALFEGYWLVRMYEVTRNPLFPYFNEYFRSPLARDFSYRDTRFLPHGLWHAILDPILFSINWRVANDLPCSDIRVGVAYVLLLTTLALALVLWLRRSRLSEDPLTKIEPTRALFAFVAVSYLAWLVVFAIYRYILTLEMLAPIVIVAALGLWPLRRRLRYAALAALGIAIAVTTRADMLKRAPLGDPYVQLTMPPIAHPNHTMILMTGEAPMGYLVPELPPQIPVIRIDGWLIRPNDGSLLTAQAKARVHAFRGQLYLIADPAETMRARRALADYGLAFTADKCLDMDTNLGGPYMFCPLTRKRNEP